METPCHKAQSINSNGSLDSRKQETPSCDILLDDSWTKPEEIPSHSDLDPPLLHELSKNKRL